MRLTIVAVILLTGCGASTSSATALERFKNRLDAGATCAELFEIRNSVDPHSPYIPTMNEDLRSLQCYSSTSLRK